MCLIIDSCTIQVVFGSSNSDYEPIRKWIYEENGKMIIGGTKYISELSKLSKYLRFIAELSRQGKVVTINKKSVDKTQRKIKNIEPKKDFDDSHIVALVEESGCRIVCTLDKKSDKYLKDNRFYKKARKPSIYRNASHSHLLCEKNIVAVCRKNA